MKQSPLSRVESLLRKVVEEPFTWLAGDSLDPFRLATYLAQRYEKLLIDSDQPIQFTIYVSPQDYDEIAAGVTALEAQVADYLTIVAARRNIRLQEAPRVRFMADPLGASHHAEALVETVDSASPKSVTEVLELDGSDSVMEAIRLADAFLIIQGRRHVPLDRPVTRIGRRVDNDIVLDSASISRQHAQIRWRQRYFVLYDVSSHNRTAVNGLPTREHILRPGDVIALSDVLIVYGEGRDDFVSAMPELENEEIDTTLLKPE